jgi:hypothetical protein
LCERVKARTGGERLVGASFQFASWVGFALLTSPVWNAFGGRWNKYEGQWALLVVQHGRED